jgi:hypothetical protein
VGRPVNNKLSELPDIINRVFDLLELIVVRLALLGLTALGAYTIIRGMYVP